MAVSQKAKAASNHGAQKDPKGKIIRRLGLMQVTTLRPNRPSLLTLALGKTSMPPSILLDCFVLIDTLDLAVARTTLQHPFLQVGIVDEDARKPSYTQLDSMDLKHHVQWREIGAAEDASAAVQDVLRAEMDLRTEDQDTRPGWRLIVLHSPVPQFLDIILMWNHTTFDGMSAKILHEDILHYLNTPVSAENAPVIKDRVLKLPSSQLKVPLAQEKMYKFTTTAGYACTEVWKEFAPESLTGMKAVHVNWAPLSHQPIQTGLLFLTVDKHMLQTILAKCRSHKTTITGLLHALLAVSFAQQLPRSDAPRFMGETAINMRRYTPRSKEVNNERTIANIISTLNTTFDVEKVRERCKSSLTGTDRLSNLEECVWELAEYARSDIEKELKRGLKNTRVGLMKLIPDWREHHRLTMKKPRTLSWILSNIGVFDGNPQNSAATTEAAPWTIQNSVFALSCMPQGGVIELCAVGVKGGDLCINVSWHEPAVSEKFVHKTVDDLREWLNFLGAP
ncbi:putative alcohol acetyltransferase FCK4 [Paramyrothecium foliicola]|nr:putative alcohol acetyltransferase FCK4 [Paramyrothecium foliicola]